MLSVHKKYHILQARWSKSYCRQDSQQYDIKLKNWEKAYVGAEIPFCQCESPKSQ